MTTIQRVMKELSGRHQLTQVAKNMCEVVGNGGEYFLRLLEDGDEARGDGRGRKTFARVRVY